MMRPDAKVEKVYLYPKPVDFRNSSTAWSANNCGLLLINKLVTK